MSQEKYMGQVWKHLGGIDLTVEEGDFMHYWDQMVQVNQQRSGSSLH